jgi:hypothetical protein
MANPKRSTWSLKKFPIAVLERDKKKKQKLALKIGKFFIETENYLGYPFELHLLRFTPLYCCIY